MEKMYIFRELPRGEFDFGACVRLLTMHYWLIQSVKLQCPTIFFSFLPSKAREIVYGLYYFINMLSYSRVNKEHVCKAKF